MASPENIDIDKDILENIDIDINKGILQDIDIDKDLAYRTPLLRNESPPVRLEQIGLIAVQGRLSLLMKPSKAKPRLFKSAKAGSSQFTPVRFLQFFIATHNYA